MTVQQESSRVSPRDCRSGASSAAAAAAGGGGGGEGGRKVPISPKGLLSASAEAAAPCTPPMVDVSSTAEAPRCLHLAARPAAAAAAAEAPLGASWKKIAAETTNEQASITSDASTPTEATQKPPSEAPTASMRDQSSPSRVLLSCRSEVGTRRGMRERRKRSYCVTAAACGRTRRTDTCHMRTRRAAHGIYERGKSSRRRN